MASISYNDNKINNFVQDINSIAKVLEDLNIDCKSSVEMIVNARGFNEYVSNVDNSCFDPYFEECSFSVKGISEKVRLIQSEILLYNDDKDSIKAFLNSLSEEEVLNSSDELKSVYSKMVKETSNIFERTGATLFTSVISAVEGILDLGETLIDLGDLAITGAKSIFASCYDLVTGKFNTEDSTAKKLFEDCKARVSEKTVESIFDSFYENNDFGRDLKDKSYFFDHTRNISKGIVSSMGIVGVGILTGGSGFAAGSLSAGRLATVAGTIAMSTNTEDAWANGASVGDGLKRGLVGAVWDGAQWFVGAKIGAPGGYGDKFAKTIFKSSSAGAVAASRIGLDAVDSGLEGFVQPLLDLMYKDSYVNANGETVKFDASMTFADKYREAFDDAGGMGNVFAQGAIGAGGSAIGEFSDMKKLLKPEGDGKLDLNAGSKTIAGTAGLSLVDRVKNIFKSDVNSKAKVDTDIDINLRDVDTPNSRLDVDAPNSRLDVDAESRVNVSDTSVRNGKEVFDSDISITRTESDVTLRSSDSDVEMRSSFDNADGVFVAGDSINEPFSLDFRDSDGNVVDFKDANVYSDGIGDTNSSTGSIRRDVLATSLNSTQKQHLKVLDDIMVAGGKDLGYISSTNIKRQLSNFDSKVIAAYIENNSSNVDFTMQLVGGLEGSKLSQVVSHIMTTPSSMSVVGTLNTFQILECLDNPASVDFISDFSVRLSDTQITKTINDLTFRLESDGRFTFDGYDIEATLKKLTPEANKIRLQRLLNDNSFARPDVCKKVFDDLSVSNSKKVYEMSVADYDSYGRLSSETRNAINSMESIDSVKLIESSFEMNNPQVVYEIIDSIAPSKMPDIVTRLKNTKYESMFIERLKGSQVSNVVRQLDDISAQDFISKLSKYQAESTLKSVYSTNGKLSFDVMESLLKKVDTSQIDKLITSGYLDKYCSTLDFKHLKGSVLEEFCLYVPDGQVIKINSGLLPSSSLKTLQSSLISLKNGHSISQISDIRTANALLKFAGEFGIDNYASKVFSSFDYSTTLKVTKQLISTDKNLASNLFSSLDSSTSVRVFNVLLNNNSASNFNSIEFFLKNISNDNLNKLLNSGSLDSYVCSLTPEQVSKSMLSDNIVRIFPYDDEKYPHKYLLLTDSQISAANKLSLELDSCFKNGRFSESFVTQFKNSNDKVVFKVLDDFVCKYKRPNVGASVLEFLGSSRRNTIIKKLADFDPFVCRKLIAGMKSPCLADFFSSYQVYSNSKYFDIGLESVSSVQFRDCLQLVKDVDVLKKMPIKEMDFVLKCRSIALDNDKLAKFISQNDNGVLSRVMNDLSNSRLVDSNAVALRLLNSIEPSRVDDMIASGSLKYCSKYPDDIKLRILETISSDKLGYFDKMNVSNSLYGVDQGINDVYTNIVAKDLSSIDCDDLKNFLIHDGSFSEGSAARLIGKLKSGDNIGISDYNMIKKYLASEVSGSPSRVLELNRKCFKRKADVSYKNIFDKMSKCGMSQIEVAKMIDTFNTDVGACSYASVCNIIVDNYRSNPAAFERDFGFSLYIDGKNGKTINSLELMTDIFTTVNSNKFGGKIFTTTPSGALRFVDDKVNGNSQLYLSNFSGMNQKVIERYLRSKNPNLSFNVNSKTFSFDSTSVEIPLPIEGLKKKISDALSSNKSVSLGIYSANNRVIDFYVEQNGNFKKYTSTSTWNEGGGHAVFVTGITNEHIIVSSWGKKFYFPIKCFYNNNYVLNISDIGGIK